MLHTCAHAIALWLTTLACLMGWLVDMATMPGGAPGELPWLWALHLVTGAVACAHAPLRRTLPLILIGALLAALLAPTLRPLWSHSQHLSLPYIQWRALAAVPAALLLIATLRAPSPAQALSASALAWMGALAHGLLCLHRTSTPAHIGISAFITAWLAALPLMLRWSMAPARLTPLSDHALARRVAVGAALAACLLAPALCAAALDQSAPEALLNTSPFYRDPAFTLAHQLQRALRELTAGTTSLLLADWPTQLAPLRPPRYTHAALLTQAALAPLLALALSWARACELGLDRPLALPAARRAIWTALGALAIMSLLVLWQLPELPMRPHTAVAIRWGLAALPWLGAALCAAHLMLGADASWSALAAPLLSWGVVLPVGVSVALPAPRVALVLIAAASAMTTWLALRHAARGQT